MDATTTIDRKAVERALSGAGAYDMLGVGEQALVRAEWERRSSELRASLNYAEQFSAEGETYSEADQDGRLIVHPSSL